jgi:hypothetical protein
MKVEFFDSMEQVAARLEQAMQAADARVRPWQAALAPGDCFIADGGEEDLLVFGEVLEGYAEARLRHYRFCRCHSVACPEGELGDVHVSTVLCRISRGFFEQMKAAGWAAEGPPARLVGDGAANRGAAETPPLARCDGCGAGRSSAGMLGSGRPWESSGHKDPGASARCPNRRQA